MSEAEFPIDTPDSAFSEASEVNPEVQPGVSTDASDIPDKLYFRIGEVSRLLGVEPYVLRYWETEFPSLSPKKSDTGHRLYKRKDVEQLLRIKELLYAKRFTIEGARAALATHQKEAREARHEPPRVQPSLFGDSALPDIRRELASILDLLR